jgi:pimeloyl-ACP methyl ester carboxylesterase
LTNAICALLLLIPPLEGAQFVQNSGGAWRPLSQVLYGEEFQVEVVYPAARTEASKTASLTIGTGPARNVVLQRVSRSATVFRSQPMAIAATGQFAAKPGDLIRVSLDTYSAQATVIGNLKVTTSWGSGTKEILGLGSHRIEGQTKPIWVTKYEPAGGAPLTFEVALDVPAGTTPPSVQVDLTGATFTVNAFNRIGGSEVYSFEVSPRFRDDPARGTAIVPVSDLLRGTSSFVNQNAIEVTGYVTLRGKRFGNVAPNLLHIALQKLIVFVPGVFGSSITVNGFMAFPEASLLDSDFAKLACNQSGVPLTPPSAVDLFRKYAVETIYNVEDRAEYLEPPGLVKLYYDRIEPSKRVKPFILVAWPYDWRIELEKHVAAMFGSPATALKPPYPQGPSMRRLIEGFGETNGYLDDKVVLVGHSTGGVVMNGALRNPECTRVIDRAFFVDVPFWGAPKAYFVFLTGEMGIPFIRNSIMRRLAPNVPIVYYLAPTGRYPGAVTVSPAFRRDDGTSPTMIVSDLVRQGRLFDQYPGAREVDPWNILLEVAADIYHSSIQGPPLIGYEKVRVFWSQAPNSETIGSIYVDEDGYHFNKTTGDGTVPSVSQKADWPDECLVQIPTNPLHVPSPNEPFVWQTIVRTLTEDFRALR